MYQYLPDPSLGRRQWERGFGRILAFFSFVTLASGNAGLLQPARYANGKTPTKLPLLAQIGELAFDVEVASSVRAAATPAATPLECFQVAEPVLTPSSGYGEEACTVTLMEHTFANSYGSPFVGNYTPPSCDFDHVVMNFTVEVKGRQYDRWGSMYLGNVNVFSTSTAEPTATGIRWTWLKDMTPYLSLWKEDQTVIFQLDNVVNDIYTGLLNTTLTATFFKSSVRTGGHAPADLILPVSAGKSPVTGSFWTVPEENATTSLNFPRNVNRAVFSVAVKGQGNEEFWWSNVPESDTHTFDPDVGTYPGYSPWRELQVLIDGQLAGVHWPYPTIFTGGVVPQLHRPIVATDAFDLRDHEIDITPWLPLLCDGNNHTFDLRMIGLVDDGKSSASLSSTVESSWYLVGKVFLWLDEDENAITTGTIGANGNADPTIGFSQSITQNATGFNETLDFSLSVSRDFSVSTLLTTQKRNGTATWSQKLSYSNLGGLYANGFGGINTFEITGRDTAESPGWSYSTSYNYPLYCNTTQSTSAEGNLTLWAVLDQGLNLEVEGNAVYATGLEAFEAADGTTKWIGSVINTERNGTANYSRYADNTVSTGIGSTDQVFYFGGLTESGTFDTPGTELYYRNVSAFNNTVTADYEVIEGKVVSES
ncbi:hypothetical protein JX265_008784 [Neoarthrinium moseri]|uniref:Peptide N-acetyl-beta-D-glucosaminyl asparaginase amidase A N-terminal domain-containing protein n=1 Tax=Neoarthrinium moseri TaxID=1658444 RepID=A0A9Q0AJV1_9PEZI|nr:hypothetical protein JX266_005740 [Neoarthrinium moseri]KAI1863567.1 hypothetical protein JX265_008784 [Neoarthrinium moseri]